MREPAEYERTRTQSHFTDTLLGLIPHLPVVYEGAFIEAPVVLLARVAGNGALLVPKMTVSGKYFYALPGGMEMEG